MTNIIQRLKYQYLTENLENLRILGVDFGAKKLGFAIFYWSLDEALLPLKVIVNTKPAIDIISDVVKQYCCSGVVIGNCDNGSNLKTVIKLQNKIQKKLNIPVFIQNEALTTRAADEILKDLGMKKEKREKFDDAIAAHLILSDFIWDFKNYMYKKL